MHRAVPERACWWEKPFRESDQTEPPASFRDKKVEVSQGTKKERPENQELENPEERVKPPIVLAT